MFIVDWYGVRMALETDGIGKAAERARDFGQTSKRRGRDVVAARRKEGVLPETDNQTPGFQMNINLSILDFPGQLLRKVYFIDGVRSVT